jgi:tRNA-uridine 2-sulfurtransferase
MKISQLLEKVKNPSKQKPLKILVAMSGGVDSSVAAAAMHHHGHEVIGVTLQLYDHGIALERKGACCAGQDIYDAQIAASSIGIPHYVLNYESIFKAEVIDKFVDSYTRGETPIPCVQCNKSVKFRDLFKFAKDLNVDLLITGHYIQKLETEDGAQLHKAIDNGKDQSYFLFSTTKEQLSFVDFPLGGLYKEETRKLAEYFGLKIAAKPDSQDICFVPNGDYKSVIHKIQPGAFDKGEIVDKNGKVLGSHSGIIGFTIGQRRGISISSPEPLYVIGIDPSTKRVIVGKEEDLYSQELFINDINWLGTENFNEIHCSVKMRSSHIEIPATLHHHKDGIAKVTLHQPYKGITPGQACVMYQGSRLLGGGWIMRSDAVH